MKNKTKTLYKKGEVWTREEILTMQYLYREGNTLNSISQILGRPYRQCKEKLKRSVELSRKVEELKALDVVLEMVDFWNLPEPQYLTENKINNH